VEGPQILDRIARELSVVLGPLEHADIREVEVRWTPLSGVQVTVETEDSGGPP
jgi:hypothetical protein